MILNHADRAKWENVVSCTLARLSDHYGFMIARPQILWNMRGTSVMGQAIGTHTIRLHPEAAAKFGDAYEQTVVHEACHIAVHAYKRHHGVSSREGRWSAHGLEWKTAMRVMGRSPDRCSANDAGMLTPARTVKRYAAKCGCQTFELTAVRMKKLHTYRCRKCGSGLLAA